MKHDELAILNPPTLPAKAFQIPLKLATCSSPPKGNHHPAVSAFSNSNLLRDRKSWERAHQDKDCTSQPLVQRV